MTDAPPPIPIKPPMPEPRQPFIIPWRRWLTCAALMFILAVVAWVPYSNCLDAEFVFDSEAIIKYDVRLRDPKEAKINLLHPSKSGEIWTSHYWHCESSFYDLFYRPLVTLSYAINYWPFRGQGELLQAGTPISLAAQRSFHFVNWAIHLANVLLLFLLARKLFTRYSGLADVPKGEPVPGTARVWPVLAAFVSAALFAVHPIHTEAVTNIVGRADLMSTFFVIVGFFCHMRSRESQTVASWFWMAGTATALTLGLLVKESTIVLIAVAVLYDLSLAATVDEGIAAKPLLRWKTRAVGYGIAAVLTALFFWVRWLVLKPLDPSYVDGLNNPLVDHGFIVSRLTALKVVGKQIFLLLWPARLSPDYSYNAIPVFSLDFSRGGLLKLILEDGKALVALAVLIGFIVFAVKTWRRHSMMAFLVLAFLVSLMPTSNLLLEIGTIMAERFLYLSNIWFCLFVGLVFVYLARRFSIVKTELRLDDVSALTRIVPNSTTQLTVVVGGFLLLALAALWPFWWRLLPIWLNPDLLSQMTKDVLRGSFLLCVLWMLPIAGVIILMWPSRRAQQQRVSFVMCALLAAVVQLAAVRTFARNIDWCTTHNLWRHAVFVLPESSKTHVNYVNSLSTGLLNKELFEQKDWDRLDDAIHHSEIAWGMKRYATFGANLGAFYVLKADKLREAAARRGATPAEMSRVDGEAIRLYQKALGVLLESIEDEKRMVRVVHEALLRQGKPLYKSKAHGNPAIYQNLGTVFLRLNQPLDAAKALRHAIALDPYNSNSRVALADVYLRAGQMDDGALALVEVVILDARNVSAGQLLSQIYATQYPGQSIIGLDPRTGLVAFTSPFPQLPERVRGQVCASLLNLARTFAGLGELERAQAWRSMAVSPACNCGAAPFDVVLKNPDYPRSPF